MLAMKFLVLRSCSVVSRLVNKISNKILCALFLAFICFLPGVTSSEENSIDLMSDDFDLLEDSSLEDLEAELDFDREWEVETLDKNEVIEEEKFGRFGIEGLSGSINQSFVFGIEDPGVSFDRQKSGLERIRTAFNFNYKGEILSNVKYKVGGLLRYDWGKLDNNQYRMGGNFVYLKLKDAYLDMYPSENIWLRIGNQIIARGQFDGLSITDTINPRDLSIPAQGELSEFRQHVPAALISIPIQNAKLELILTYDAGANNVGQPGSGFDPLVLFQNLALLGPSSLSVKYIKPSNRTELFARLNYAFNGGDLAVVFSDENLNQRNLKSVITSSFSSELHFGFDRVQKFGFSGNLARGNYLFKYEGAQIAGVPIPGKDPTILPWKKKDQSVMGFGLDYSGINNLTIGFESDIKLVQGYSEDLSGSKTSVGQAFQARWTGLKDLLSISGSVSKLNGEKSTISSLAANYNVKDGLSLGARVVRYQASSVSDSFYPYQNQDVIMLSTEYSF